jgi:hypothetical protein
MISNCQNSYRTKAGRGMFARAAGALSLRAIAVAGAAMCAVSAVPAAAQAQAKPACDRACLEQFVDRYLDAVKENKPGAVPFASNVRFTENGQELLLGDGLWNTMQGRGKYRLFVADPASGQVGFFGTIYEDANPADKPNGTMIALRLLIKDMKIVEVEQIVARGWNTPEERGFQRLDNLPLHPKLTSVIPVNERLSREVLIAQSNKYFTALQKNDGHGDYPFSPDCLRHENGGEATLAPTPAGEKRPDPKTATGYSNQWTCTEQFKSGLMGFVNRIRDRRFVAVDQERGLVFSFAFFDHSAGATRTFKDVNGRQVTAGPTQPHTWQIGEIFKIEKGNITKIDAILMRSAYGQNSGWSTWAQGMSDVMRDVSFEVPTGL